METAGSSLSSIRSALQGTGALRPKSVSASLSSSASAAASVMLKAAEGPPRTKALRYSFNSGLRESRLAADLEDLTDDEDEVRLADQHQ